MKQNLAYLTILLYLSTPTFAGTKEYVILGDQKISAEVKNNMPLPGQKAGVAISGAGYLVGAGKFIWAFDFRSKKLPTKVTIEDVSGQTPMVLVNDNAPVVNDHDWSGGSSPIAINQNDSPWVFEPGDTTKVFRFTITLKGISEPVVIFQPAVYSEASKQRLRKTPH